MLTTLIDELSTDTFETSLPLFTPELAVGVTIVVLLLSRLVPLGSKIDAVWIALLGLLSAGGLLLSESPGGPGAVERCELFTGMLVHDGLGLFARGLLIASCVVFLPLTKLTGLANRDEGQDFFVLVLGALLGMLLMARANHMMTVFLSVEMASVPSYVLAGIVKGRARSGEAALKYSVYGAAAAGVMLYGISLIIGVLGSAHLPTIGGMLHELSQSGEMLAPEQAGGTAVLALGAVLLLAGIAFKVSAAPFHFWAPDVFAGAPAEIGGFLSTASKTAALLLLMRLLLATTSPEALTTATPDDSLHTFLAVLIGVSAAATCTWGNLSALGQINVKRLFAYSTIAHAGYLLMPMAAAAFCMASQPELVEHAFSAVLIYATGYLFLNLTAFGAVALLRNALGSEALRDYHGLINRTPVAATTLAVASLGLLGLPPLIGFAGKLVILKPLTESGSTWLVGLLLVAIVNTAISLAYYLNLVRTIFLSESRPHGQVDPIRPLGRCWLVLAALPILLLGVFPEALVHLAQQATANLFALP